MNPVVLDFYFEIECKDFSIYFYGKRSELRKSERRKPKRTPKTP